jgi:hypothetical protein
MSAFDLDRAQVSAFDPDLSTSTPDPGSAQASAPVPVRAQDASRPDIARARAARGDNARRRARFLLDVAARQAPPPPDMPWFAARPGNEWVLSMSIVTYLRAVPGWGDAPARRLVAMLADMLTDREHTPLAPRAGKTRSPHAPRRLTFAWLVDARAQGRRVLAWLALTQPRTPPWSGWPVQPDPNRGTR